jgi:hypothetical protein
MSTPFGARINKKADATASSNSGYAWLLACRKRRRELRAKYVFHNDLASQVRPF